MSIKKRVLTLVLVMAMVIGSAFSVYAATGSPTNPGFVAKVGHDVNTQDHGKKATVSTHVGNTVKVVYKIEAKTGTSSVSLSVARDKKNNKVALTHLGATNLGSHKNEGVKGVFNTTAGRRVKTLDIKTTASRFRFSKQSFYGSNVGLMRVVGKNISFGKDAFNGTKKKDIDIQICGTGRKASQFTFDKGAFNGLSSKARFLVRSTAMSASEFNKLKKKLIAAGFKGKIVRGKGSLPK